MKVLALEREITTLNGADNRFKPKSDKVEREKGHGNRKRQKGKHDMENLDTENAALNAQLENTEKARCAMEAESKMSNERGSIKSNIFEWCNFRSHDEHQQVNNTTRILFGDGVRNDVIILIFLALLLQGEYDCGETFTPFYHFISSRAYVLSFLETLLLLLMVHDSS